MTAFSYANIIKSPAEMESGPKSQQLGANITALKAYSSLLLTSNSAANALSGHALGNQTWVPTNAYCVDDVGIKQKRYIYINNQPSTNTPPDKNATANMKFNGLIPGIIDDIIEINPIKLFTAFAEDGMPKCQSVALSTTDKLVSDGKGYENETYVSNFITNNDLKKISGCSFKTGINPVTKDKCPWSIKESFKNISNLPSDKAVHLYFTTLSIVALYVLYCFVKKTSR